MLFRSLEEIGINDDFFELGGQSLRAIRVANKIEQETGVRIGIKDIFDNPTAAKLALEVGQGKTFESIPKAEQKEYYEMSSTQKRMFLIDQVQGKGTTYNMPVALRMKGAVNPEKIQSAFYQIIERHEILRTSFDIVEGVAVQRISNEPNLNFVYQKDDREFGKILEDFIEPFDLQKGSLLRVKVVEQKDSWLLLVDMHHIVSDGMSSGLLMREFSRIYNGESLEPLGLQYKDYSEWMRTRDMRKQKAYWMSEFEEELPTLDIPLNYVRPKTQSFKGDTVTLKIKKELRDRVKTLAKQMESTEYMVLLSGLMVVLSKYGRQEDIVIGSPMSGRIHKDTENMMGMFVNTLVMRGKPSKEKIYINLLEEIREKSLKAYENQEYPFEELLEDLKIKRDLSRNPMFDIMFVYQNNEPEKIQAEGIEFEILRGKTNTAKFDITVNVEEEDEGYFITTEYCSDLYKEEFIETLMEHYQKVVEEVTENPNKEIGEIQVVSDAEKKMILHDFNATEKDYPKDKCVQELFEEQVEKTPDKIAVTFGQESLTYQELNHRANQLGRRLRLLGVGPNDLVPVILERSIEMIVGIYGIIKAGGAYVPIDPRDRKSVV